MERHTHRPHLRFLRKHEHLDGAFGADNFGQIAEKVARFFGTPQYIIGQSIIVVLWVAMNTSALIGLVHFDKYPYILLNLAFSTQAAYAAPLILLAQTRQAERDKAHAEATAEHTEATAVQAAEMNKQQTELLTDMHGLIKEIHSWHNK